MNNDAAEVMSGGAAGIQCEQAEVLISRHVDGEIHASDLGMLHSHLKTCVKCSCSLETWLHHSRNITSELDNMWPGRVAQRSTARWHGNKYPKLSLPKTPQGLSLNASQVLACAGVLFYIFFYDLPVQAPVPSLSRVPERTQPVPPLAEHTIPPLDSTSTPERQPSAMAPLPASIFFGRPAKSNPTDPNIKALPLPPAPESGCD